MGKLLIAKYKDDTITIYDYQESIHYGELYCPFCSRDLRVTYNKQGYFMAWRGEGGHDCGKELVHYFNADWKGREITEVLRDEKDNIEVIVDINSLIFSANIFSNNYKKQQNNKNTETNYNKFPRYRTKEKVFRDVIRSVSQMKKMIKKNKLSALKNVKFRFKTSKNKKLSFEDIVLTIDELDKSVLGKYRFIIFKVENIRWSNNKVYINSYSIKGVNFTASLYYNTYKKNLFKKFKDNNVIAYGKLSYSKDYNKFFLNLSHDFQIQKLNDNDIEKFFEETEIKSYNFKQINNKDEEDKEIRIGGDNNSKNKKIKLNTEKDKNRIKNINKKNNLEVYGEIKELDKEKTNVLEKIKLFFKSIF
ncbi:hypothetical protein [Orenia marismortui]|uniref:Uncharacterized protein n=1 Tax=Orenia marismortui TaxID=46469 RepID=A0A4R8GSF8_9FIRM|nr:hypothetical protein [Orenia marismortui]TDX48829.1 hypothetical protein C7959_1258 [Orenia marismortui]